MDTLNQNCYDVSVATSKLVPRGPVLCADELEAWSQGETAPTIMSSFPPETFDERDVTVTQEMGYVTKPPPERAWCTHTSYTAHAHIKSFCGSISHTMNGTTDALMQYESFEVPRVSCKACDFSNGHELCHTILVLGSR